ncbi:hypothetical protein [Clostridium felsineum]|uniref:hypothetical protein n=1 Tax=Clostridium felsineum TaxID=36839 RepID=UPI00214DD99C|nr:hypothetical protein [Clostridium felsineum]
MGNKHSVEKIIWTENNFDEMKWHDCRIYAFAFNEYKLMLDIDYIFEWVIPQTDEKYYKFWVSPVTIVFDNVYDLQIDIESICDLEIRIEEIYREQARMPKNKDYINKDTE